MVVEANKKILIIGSAPDAVQVKQWDLSVFDTVVVINNAWQLTDHWHYHIHPEDFPEERRPVLLSSKQKTITYLNYVPAQNQFGGFVYAGGTMAFTAAYWVLAVLKPQLMAFVGCDMVYPKDTPTHFYGTGAADPLREDISLKNLEAKAARLHILAAESHCFCANLSGLNESRLVFPRFTLYQVKQFEKKLLHTLFKGFDGNKIKQAKIKEKQLNYFIESGEYWKYTEKFDPDELTVLDTLWFGSIVN